VIRTPCVGFGIQLLSQEHSSRTMEEGGGIEPLTTLGRHHGFRDRLPTI